VKRVKGIGGFSHEPHYEGETNDWITPKYISASLYKTRILHEVKGTQIVIDFKRNGA